VFKKSPCSRSKCSEMLCKTLSVTQKAVSKYFYEEIFNWSTERYVDTFPYLGSLITEGGECTMEFRTRLNTGQVIGASLQKIWKSHSIPISAKIRLMKALVWPVATYGCESGHSETHTHTHTRLTALFSGLPGWAGTRKVNQSGFYWNKRQRVAVASAGPYASLHLAPDR